MSFDPTMLAGPYDHVADCGAHVGDFAKACLREWPGCTVDSFEPLRNLVNLDPHGRWRWHQVAVAAEPGDALFWRNEFGPSSSLLTMTEAHREAFPYTRTAWTQTVTCARLDAYGERVQGRALLKLDVQGGELAALDGAGDLLASFSAVVLEVSHVELYRGAPTALDVWAFLSAAGFKHRARVDVTRHPVFRNVLQSDELWTRD